MEKHHLLFDRVRWSTTPDTGRLRGNAWLIPPLDTDTHRALHQVVALVPVMGRHTLQLVARDFSPVRGDYVKSAEELMFTIEEAVEHPRTTQLEKDLAQLAIHAIDLQRGFIENGTR